MPDWAPSDDHGFLCDGLGYKKTVAPRRVPHFTLRRHACWYSAQSHPVCVVWVGGALPANVALKVGAA